MTPFRIAKFYDYYVPRFSNTGAATENIDVVEEAAVAAAMTATVNTRRRRRRGLGRGLLPMIDKMQISTNNTRIEHRFIHTNNV